MTTHRRLAALCLIGTLPLLAQNYAPEAQPVNSASSSASAAPASSAPASVSPANLAIAATPSTSFVSGHESLAAINDGKSPRSSFDYAPGAYGNWPRKGTQWVQYDWPRPVSISAVEVYYFDDHRGVRLPAAARLLVWDEAASAFRPAAITSSGDGVSTLGVEGDKFNRLEFPAPLTVSRLRLELDGRDDASTGVLEWRVLDAGSSPLFPPRVAAGPDRVVVVGGQTHLDATVLSTGQPGVIGSPRWEKLSGPGEVAIADATALSTSATFSEPGDYDLGFTAGSGELAASDRLSVRVAPAAPLVGLRALAVPRFSVTTPFWRDRLRATVINWIPHCVAENEKPDLKEGGLNNLLAAADKLAGRPAPAHRGYPFSNAWVLNTLEAACLAQQLEPGDDAELAAAQAGLRETIERWIPVMLAAQEPDGYFQTRYTLGTAREQADGRPPERWSPRLRTEHEGYVAGYFLEAAIAHVRMTGGKDRRLYDAARRLADCWESHIGPAPKQPWFDGHQTMELALFRFASLVDELEGPGAGDRYAALGKFLLDRRGVGVGEHGTAYDQTHLPVTRQYEAVGHAVRAVYNYAAMADVIAATGDTDYQSATLSLWENLVGRKLYLTGGIGSGETSEGFGADFSLPNNAYCESCANIGLLFFNHRLHLAYAQARYASLYEDTLYNAVLSDLDLAGQNFTYTNALDTDEARYKWHVCPCCVGNIPRALLSLPTWTYTPASNRLFVNLFVGGSLTLPEVGGGPLRVTQQTDYPWSEKVSLTLEPASGEADFALHLRVPDRAASPLYAVSPAVPGLGEIRVNGRPVAPQLVDGYAVVSRRWQAGDRVDFTVPLAIQRVHCDDRVAANRGRVALRQGPLVYNLESVDQNLDAVLPPDASLSSEWRPDLLGGVAVIRGAYADGSPLLAIPNYARNNRGGRSVVWIREK